MMHGAGRVKRGHPVSQGSAWSDRQPPVPRTRYHESGSGASLRIGWRSPRQCLCYICFISAVINNTLPYLKTTRALSRAGHKHCKMIWSGKLKSFSRNSIWLRQELRESQCLSVCPAQVCQSHSICFFARIFKHLVIISTEPKILRPVDLILEFKYQRNKYFVYKV